MTTASTNTPSSDEDWAPKALDQFLSLNDPVLINAKSRAAQLCAEIAGHDWQRAQPNPRWLVLTGPSGTGKTFLARLVFRWFQGSIATDRNKFAKDGSIEWPIGTWLDWPPFISQLRSREYWRLHAIAQPELTILDDLGAEHQTDFSTEKTIEALNRRAKRFTVITTNLTIADWAEREARIADRLIRNNAIVVNTDTQSFSTR